MEYIKLLRPKHYLKNLLILLPLFFSGSIIQEHKILRLLLGIILFSLTASSIYIINDIRDYDKDKKHPIKKTRPISSGKISKKNASVLIFLILFLVILVNLLIGLPVLSSTLLFLYFIINIGYSFGLKNVPILDVSILAAGFMIRLYYGAVISDVNVSNWLYLSVMAFSFYMGFGKRRNEFKKNGSSTRKVNEYYNQAFLDKNMYMSMCLAVVFYALWTLDQSKIHKYIIWTVPLTMAMFMTYSLSIENNESEGDPTNVFLGNISLLILACVFIVSMAYMIYLA